MAESPAEVLASERIHAGRVFEVVRERVRLASGLVQELEFVRHGGGAVAIAARRDDGRLVLVRQYRHATGETLLEVPAGRLEALEEPQQAARRELEEETGLTAGRWRELARFYAAPGFCSERLVLYLAEDLAPCGPGRRPADPDEELEVVALQPSEVLAQAHDAKTLLAALLVERSSR